MIFNKASFASAKPIFIKDRCLEHMEKGYKVVEPDELDNI